MSFIKIALVVTTIGDGEFLGNYCSQAEIEGVKDNLEIFVIPDKKTSSNLYVKCQNLKERGFQVYCPTLAEQEEYLKKIGNLYYIIPYNSDNRRNIGFLMALERECEVIISIDDDNLCLIGNDFYTEHSIVCHPFVEGETICNEDKWFNPCDLLVFEDPYRVFSRGFPYKNRTKICSYEFYEFKKEKAIVKLNMGLWYGAPDVDAITWLANPTKVKAFKGRSILLNERLWAPINTQNTSLHKDLIPAYYFIPMKYSIHGLIIDRFGDIFSGYFVQKCAKHLNHAIRIGTPLVLHNRNFHNYFQDLVKELACILIIEEIIDWLLEVKLEGSNYLEAYLSLADQLESQVERFKGSIWTNEVKGYFHRICYCMREWVKTCAKLL